MTTARNRTEPPVNRRLGFEAAPKRNEDIQFTTSRNKHTCLRVGEYVSQSMESTAVLQSVSPSDSHCMLSPTLRMYVTPCL